MKPLIMIFPALLFATTSTVAGQILLSGIGSQSCTDWNNAQRPPDPRGPKISLNGDASISVNAALLDQWVMGFVTSVNQFSAHSNMGRIQEGASDDAIVAWVSSYCMAHPLDPVVTASAHLVLELRRRAHDVEPGQDEGAQQ